MTGSAQPVITPKGRAKISFGPAGDRLPARFTGVGLHPNRPVQVTIEASFDGVNKVKAERVIVERTDGISVTPEDTAFLKLAEIIRDIVTAAIQPSSKVPFPAPVYERTGPPTDDELFVLATIYWREHVAWGTPRLSGMEAFGLTKSTTNLWIKKTRALGYLPARPGDEED